MAQGALSSFLRAIQRPEAAVFNLLRGNVGGAARQVAGIASDVIDAPLPGDWLPDPTRPEDWTTASDALGLQDLPRPARTFVDALGGMVVNPLSYVSRGTSAAKALRRTQTMNRRAQKGLAEALANARGRPDVPEGVIDDVLARLQAPAVGEDTVAAIMQRHASKVGRRNPQAVEDWARSTYRAAGGDMERIINAAADSKLVSTADIMFGNKVLAREGQLGTWFRDTGKRFLDAAVPQRLKPAAQRVGARAREVAQSLRVPLVGGKAAAAALDPGEDITRLLQTTLARGNRVVGTEMAQAAKLFQGVTRAEDRLIADIFDDVIRDGAGQIVGQRGGGPLMQRARAAVSGQDAASSKRVLDAVRGIDRLSKQQVANLKQARAVPPDWQPDIATDGYLMRQWKGIKDTGDRVLDLDAEIKGIPNALRGRQLDTGADILSFAQGEGRGVRLVESAADRMAARIQQQGRMVARADLARKLLGANTADPQLMGLVGDTVETMAKSSDPTTRELGKAMLLTARGQAPRGLVTRVLAATNRFFKPAAVYGFVIPRASAIVRNRLSGVWQAASVPGVSAAQSARNVARDLREATLAGIQRAGGFKNVQRDELGRTLKYVDDVFERAGGNVDQARQLMLAGRKNLPEGMGQYLDEAMEQGVLDGFVSSESIAPRLFGKPEWWRGLAQMPQEMFQTVESRMRLGSYLDLRRANYTPRAAARMVDDAYLNYRVVSPENRMVRDLVPFAQFALKSIPQQAGLLTRRPAVATALSHLYGQDPDEPVEPWLAQQMTIPLGDDKMVAGIGLPVEALNVLPSLGGRYETGEELRMATVAQAHPLLRYLWTLGSGRDPYFGSKAGTYSRTPQALRALGLPEYSEAGRIYRELAGTGMIQPVQSVVGIIDQATDQRFTPGERALRTLTGARVVENDPDKAMINLAQGRLRTDPSVKSLEIFYTQNDDSLQLIQQIKDAKRRMRERERQRADAADI